MDQPIDIEKFNSGDDREFARIYVTYYERLYNFARNIVDNDQEAEDAVVEGFTKLFKRYTDFSLEITIRSFLYVTIRNRCLNYLKSRNRRIAKENDFAEGSEYRQEAEAENRMIKAEIAKELTGRISLLPPKCRKVYELHRQGLSNEEISNRLGISKGNVSTQLGIANARLFGVRQKE